MRFLLRLLLKLIGAFIILMACAVAWLATPKGLPTLLWVARTTTAGTLTFKGATGNLMHTIHIASVDYQSATLNLQLNNASLHWTAKDLLSGTLSLTSLTIERLHIQSLTTAKPNTPTKQHTLTIPSLPLAININHANIKHITYQNGTDQPITIPAIRLNATINNRQLLLNANLKSTSPFNSQTIVAVAGTPAQYSFSLNSRSPYFNGTLKGKGQHHQISVSLPKSLLFKGHISGTATANWDGPLSWTLKTHWQSGQNTVSINGKHVSAWALKWHIHVTNLNHFIPMTTGDINSNGSITGSNKTPLITGTLMANRLSIDPNTRVKSVNAHWHIDLSNNTPSHATAILTKGKLGAQAFHKIVLSLVGNPSNQTLTISNQGALGQLHVSATGHYNQKATQWTGTLHRLRLQSNALGNWHLKAPTQFNLQPNAWSLAPLCWKSRKNALCFNASKQANNTLQGTLTAHLNNTQVLNPLFDDNLLWNGPAAANFSLSGTLNNPLINGELDLQNASAKLPDMGLVFSQTQLHITSKDDRTHYKLSLKDNGSPLNITGYTLQKNGHTHTVLSVSGTHIPLMATSEYDIQATPSITIAIKPNHTLTVNGKIYIPNATISPTNFASTNQLPTEDIIYVHNKDKRHFLRRSLDVSVILGKHININTYGVTGKASGKLILNKKPNTALLATGKISLNNGTYTTHGQKLTIAQGELTYNNMPLSNPQLDINAIRKITTYNPSGAAFNDDNLTVGVRITGNTSSPKTTLFANPATLSDSDILSYLVFGHSGGTGGVGLLLQAVNAAGSGESGLGSLTSGLQKGLGLAEFGVESETSIDSMGSPLSSQSMFVIGKYLTPKIYLRFSRGLVQDVNTLTLRYLFNHKWSVAGNASTLGNGIDGLYSFERR